MTREELTDYIKESYNVEPDRPWDDDNIVFRHPENGKWFALCMNVPAGKLGLDEEGGIEIMNVKCDEIIAASLLGAKGYFPAYHMNKSHWVTLAIERLPQEEIIQLLDLSFALTEKKIKIKKK